MDGEKRCYVCHETKPLSSFYLTKSRPDGHRADCRSCSREKATAAWDKDKDLITLFRRKHYIQTGHDQKTRHSITGIVKRDYPHDCYCEVCHINHKLLSYHHWDDTFPSWGVWMCAGCHAGTSFVENHKLVTTYVLLRDHIEKTYKPDVSNAPLTFAEFKQRYQANKPAKPKAKKGKAK